MTERRALVMGAGGFLGSHVCQALVRAGWTLIGLVRDAACAQTRQRLRGIGDRMRMVEGDARDPHLMGTLVRDVDAILPFAGRSAVADSMTRPMRDLDANLCPLVALLAAMRENNPGALVVYPSSRLVYAPRGLRPVDEHSPLRPKSAYAIHKLAAETYLQLYQETYGINSVRLRISNVYGPDQGSPGRESGIVGTFMNIAIAGGTIRLYGGGSQLRDFVHVAEVAALVTTIVDVGHQGAGVFNVGASPSVSIGDLARQVVATVGSGAVTSTPWPPESRHIETGHYVGDYRRVRVAYGWTATTPLGEGLEAAWRRHRASVPA